MKRLPYAAALLLVGGAVLAQGTTPQPAIDSTAYPALARMMATLQNSSEASRYCAQTGGLFLEADALLRQNMAERDVVAALVKRGQGKLGSPETARLRQLADGVTQMASGFKQLTPESSAVAYTQTCLASTRAAPGTRDQHQLTERYTDALACDKRFAPGSLEGKECIAKAFHYR